jgi:hypothetical protein
MADRYLLESGTPDGYLLEDGSGVLILEEIAAGADVFFDMLHRIDTGIVAATAAGLGGVLQQ